MKVSSRHTVEISVPLPVGVSVRMGERRMHITADSSNSPEAAARQVKILSDRIMDAIEQTQG